MTGKYSAAASVLPVAGPRDGEFQERVEQAKETYLDRRSGPLAAAYKLLRAEKDDLEEKVAALNVRIAAVEQLAWSALEAEGIESVRVAGGGYFGTTEDISVVAEDRDAVRVWIESHELGRMLTVNAKTLESLVKERLVVALDAHASFLEKDPSELTQEEQAAAMRLADLPPVRLSRYRKTIFRKN